MDCPICKRDHPETDARALAILSATPHRLEKLTSSLTPRNAAASPVRGKWSAKEIIAHLNDGEVIYGLRYRRIAAEPGAPLPAFDQELWAKELQYRKQPLKANLESFAALRKQNLALLKVLPKGVWTQVSPHPEYGTLSLRELVVHLAYHDRSHTSQVERIASALGRSSKKRKSAKKRRKVAPKVGRKRSPQPARRRGVAGPPPPRLRRVRRSDQSGKRAKAKGRAAGRPRSQSAANRGGSRTGASQAAGPRGSDSSRG